MGQQDDGLESKRQAAYQKVTGMGLAAIEKESFSSLDGKPIVAGADFDQLFAQEIEPVFTVRLGDEQERSVPLKFPGRVLLATASPSKEGDIVRDTLDIRLSSGIKLYTFFLMSAHSSL